MIRGRLSADGQSREKKQVIISGCCLCGQARYTASEQPVLTAFCHCRSSQKASGAGYSANVAVPTAAPMLRT